MHIVRIAFAMVFSVFLAASVHAADRRISADQLKIKTDGAHSQIVFTSKDPNFLFPGLGEDPVANGATIEIIPATTAPLALTMPAGAGKPGWSVNATSTQYKFANALAPGGISVVKTAALKQGRYLKFTARQGVAGLTPFTLRAIAVRITIGSTRNCALYGPVGVRTINGKTYVKAKKVPAPEPVNGDCSDASLGLPDCEVTSAPACDGYCYGTGVCVDGGSGCMCAAPCGGIGPTCDGVCPSGEECFAGAGVGCHCLPTGSTPCGATGTPTCGGICADGNACRNVIGQCLCISPSACVCPSGFTCIPDAHPPLYSCAPDTCAGTYPTCGGSCGDGGVCRPAVSGANDDQTNCVCAVPGDCETACGGMDCPSGQVCHAGDCGCGAP